MILPRLYPILDTQRVTNVVDAARAMSDGGAEILQLRHKGQWTPKLLGELEEISQLPLTLIVNDRVDIAKLAGAGVHLGQTDLPPRDARKIAGRAVIGFSTHNRAQLAASNEEPIDYVALGPIFATVSKDNPDPTVGIDRLQEWRKLSTRPLVAIGGVTRHNARQAIEAGADSLAVIADLYPDPPTPSALRARIEEWLTLLRG